MASGSGKFWGGLLIGGTIGAVVGILVAPRSGRETRRRLRQSTNGMGSTVQYHADRLADQFSDQLTGITESAQRTLDDTSERLQEAIAVGQEASRKLSQELKLTAPQSEDQDGEMP